MANVAAGGKSVLLVDDDAGMIETLADIFQANKYHVTTARSGEAAVAIARRGAYDLVLMDIQMPGLDGVQALAAMKAEGLTARVVMMTAYTRDELVREAEARSGFPVLPKPLDMERVLSLATGAIGRAGERP